MKALLLRKNGYGMDVSGEVNDDKGNIRDTSDSPQFNQTTPSLKNTPQDVDAEADFPGLGASKFKLPPSPR